MLRKMLKKNLMIGMGAFCIAGLGGCAKDIGEEAAKNAALDDLDAVESSVTEVEVLQDRNNGRKVYEVGFSFEGVEYTYEILAADGTVLSMEQTRPAELLEHLKYMEQCDEEMIRLRDELTQRKQEMEMLLAEIPDGEAAEKLRTELKETEEEIEVLNHSIENREKFAAEQEKRKIFTEQELEELVLQRVPGAEKEDLTMQKKTEDGYEIYSGNISYEKKRYTFEIDAETGTVVYWCMEPGV